MHFTLLLGKNPNENQWRFIGGFVDPTDGSDEDAARRELREEAGAIEVGPMEYITSQKVDDWRYRQTEDGIMTRLFITEYLWGRIEPSDDISELLWVDIDEVDRNISTMIIEEHQQLMVKLITLIKNNKTQIKYVTTEKN